jgi:hypothetical protein
VTFNANLTNSIMMIVYVNRLMVELRKVRITREDSRVIIEMREAMSVCPIMAPTCSNDGSQCH